ncbi:MAG: hypothetical protein C4318_05295 [Acidimicrobiia bacterium]
MLVSKSELRLWRASEMRLENVISWDRFVVLGHRGNPRRKAENTLESFVDAVSCGADGVELDVHLSQDEVPVVCHDPQVLTTSGEKVTVGLAPWKVLSRLEVVLGETTGRLCRLEEVLDALDRHLVDVELKDLPLGDPKLANSKVGQVAARVIKERGAQDRAMLSSFYIPHLKKAESVEPFVPRGWLLPPGVAASDSIPLAAAEGMAYLLPHASGIPSDVAGLEKVVDLAQNSGIELICWTVDEPDAARRLREAGASGVITDDPEGIAAALRE